MPKAAVRSPKQKAPRGAGQRGGHWGTAGLGDEAGEAVVGVYNGLAGVSGGGLTKNSLGWVREILQLDYNECSQGGSAESP